MRAGELVNAFGDAVGGTVVGFDSGFGQLVFLRTAYNGPSRISDLSRAQTQKKADTPHNYPGEWYPGT